MCIYIIYIYIYDVVLCLVVYGFQRFEDAPGTLLLIILPFCVPVPRKRHLAEAWSLVYLA